MCIHISNNIIKTSRQKIGDYIILQKRLKSVDDYAQQYGEIEIKHLLYKWDSNVSVINKSKKLGNLYELVYKLGNLVNADFDAQEHHINYGIIKHRQHLLQDLLKLQFMLKYRDYHPSINDYSIFKIYEPKEREIYRLSYYPHRIIHHAIMNVLEPIWKNVFIKNTYACIKGRGIHLLEKHLYRDLQNHPKETVYCAKMDIRHFYPSVDHEILKKIIRKKIKDKKLLNLLDAIIDSAPGLPIGNYLSQYLSNLYLTYFDHWCKEELKIKFYYRYADDIVLLSDNKEQLRNWIIAIKMYLTKELKLTLKPNYQIFPVESRGIDYVGYVIRHKYILLRKSIKNNLKKDIRLFKQHKMKPEELIPKLWAYGGWLKYCDSKHLLQKIEEWVGFKYSNWRGIETKQYKVRGKYIVIYNVDFHPSYFRVQFIRNHKAYWFKSKSMNLALWLNHFCNYPLTIKL